MVKFLLSLIALNNSDPIQYKISLSPEEIRTIFLPETQGNMESKPIFGASLNIYTRLGIQVRFQSHTKFLIANRSNKNSWKRYLKTTLQSTTQGSIVLGNFTVSPIIIGLTFFWFIFNGGLTLFGPTTDPLRDYLFPVAPILMAYIGRLMSKKDERAVIGYLNKTFAPHIISKELPPEYQDV